MDPDISTPGWDILRAIEAFNLAARERIVDPRFTPSHRAKLKAMRDRLNDIEIELRDLVS